MLKNQIEVIVIEIPVISQQKSLDLLMWNMY